MLRACQGGTSVLGTHSTIRIPPHGTTTLCWTLIASCTHHLWPHMSPPRPSASTDCLRPKEDPKFDPAPEQTTRTESSLFLSRRGPYPMNPLTPTAPGVATAFDLGIPLEEVQD
ncbi:unnamed protein product [Caretta caretta]